MRLTDVAAGVPRRAAFFGTLFAALVTLPGLGIGTLWDNSETAYGEVAREIAIYHDPLVMHLNGQPWFVQPPLYFWIAALCAKLFGVGAFALRLPSALATIAMGGAVGYATARIAGGAAGVYAAIVLSTSLMQAIVGRLAIMDALLDLAVTAAILWGFRAFEPAAGRDALDRRKRGWAVVGCAAAIALGTLAKGPVAPAVTAMVLGAWLVWERLAGRPIGSPSGRAVVSAVFVAAVIALPWFVLLAQRVGPGAVAELIGHYTFGRYTGVIENQRGPWYYYLPVIVLGFFPWIAFVPMALVRAVERAGSADGALARLALVWIVVPVAFFSFAQTKLPNYVALTFPAFAAVTGLWFAQIREGADRRAAVVSAALVPASIGAIAFAIAVFGHVNDLRIAAVGPQLSVLGAGMLAGSVATVVATARAATRARAPFVLAITSLALVYFIVFVAEPVAERLKPIPRLAQIIDRDRGPGDAVAIRGVPGGNGLVFYTAPGVKTIDADTDRSFLRTICSSDVTFVVTRGNDVATLEALARRVHYQPRLLGRSGRTALLRVAGHACPANKEPGTTAGL